MTKTKTKPPAADAVLSAIQSKAYTDSQLWEIQTNAAEALMDDNIGVMWSINVPFIPGLEFDEQTLLAVEVHEVNRRIGITLPQLRYEGLITNGSLIFELVRARLIHSMEKSAQDADAIMAKCTMEALLNAVDIAPISPDPKDVAAES